MRLPARNVIVLTLSLATAVQSQSAIKVRTIGPILATSTENVGQGVTVRATSDGHVIVGAGARQRVYVFDSALRNFTVVVDSGSGTGTMPIRTAGLSPSLADSTLLPDVGANALLVLDATGKQVRSMAPPRAQDLIYLGLPAGYGRPGLDAKGRLIYRGQIQPKFQPTPTPSGNQKLELKPVNSDSAPIVRGDFDTRRVDTLAWMKTPSQGKMALEMKPNQAGGPPTMVMHMQMNPFATADEWSVLNDGTVAILRVQDYHVDWIDPDGRQRSSPKMPIEWRRYTDAERTQLVDSLKRIAEESIKQNNASRPPGSTGIRLDLSIVPDSEFPSFWPPVEQGSVLADLDGHLWILPTVSTNAGNGFTYDVVNRTGEVVERVQLPKSYVLVGFGPHNVVYLTKADGKNTYLARALLSVPAK